MEMKSPPPCPPTVTIRRNPPRKARATPSSAIPLREPISASPSIARPIFSGDHPPNPKNPDTIHPEPETKPLTENLKVFLRIRPLTVQKNSKIVADSKNAWPKNAKTKSNNLRPKTKKIIESCVQVNEDLRSVTVSTPQSLQETKRIKSEVHEGFSHVFGSEASQSDVYGEMVKPLVDDFLKGKSGMLAAMGPSGSGKTHTVFGCAREPGMVPLALRRIFSEDKNCATDLSRVFYLSMFEISTEKGKAERMVDLLHDGGDVGMQHSVLKGLQEAVVCDAQKAESLIAHGMLKRATATTNSNSQSSRSQCIINIRYDSGKDGEEVDSNAMLTIVDLAGAEREKKTGNQGARLLESNFINNTSMVFGLCLRSLLEHQKNRNKLLQKHYKNSLLTRYLRDYLEGKKRMMLILTVKPGVEDYLDTSFLLRQASPFTKIKFKTLEEPVISTSNKRPNQALPPVEQLKKFKFSESEVSLINKGNMDRGSLLMRKEKAGKAAKDCINPNIEDISDENLNEIHVSSDESVGLRINEESSVKGDFSKMPDEKNREYQIMQGLSKALLSVLKQYKAKLKGVETENCHLRDSLINEKTRSLDLENELASEKKRLLDLENELLELGSRCTYRDVSTDAVPDSLDDASSNLSQYQRVELQEVNLEVSSCSLKQLDESENDEKTDPSATNSIVTSVSCSGGAEHYSQQFEDPLEQSDETEVKDIKDICNVDVCVRSQEYSSCTKSADLVCYEDKCIEDVSSRSEASSESSAIMSQVSSRSEASSESGPESDQDAVNISGDVNNLEAESVFVSGGSCHAASVESESPKCSRDYGDVEDTEDEPVQLEDGTADEGLSLVEDQIVCVSADSKTIIISCESPPKDDICVHRDEERLNSEAHKVDPPVAVPPKQGSDAENITRFIPKHDSCTNLPPTEKPKRRLLPASSVLLKDIGILDIKDENDKPKVKFLIVLRD
ncbi:kinesin-like protein kif3a [Phtheirospermum japonicum]|uniref:Kinesin-like protein n=1 Tax=Phtheirospermum japonicum TaxID=374723 RepID=A0A830C7H9_9LAMI|nr:kinesin-like protein kif3a [Phtheirospermum japonicum]